MATIYRLNVDAYTSCVVGKVLHDVSNLVQTYPANPIPKSVFKNLYQGSYSAEDVSKLSAFQIESVRSIVSTLKKTWDDIPVEDCDQFRGIVTNVFKTAKRMIYPTDRSLPNYVDLLNTRYAHQLINSGRLLITDALRMSPEQFQALQNLDTPTKQKVEASALLVREALTLHRSKC